MKLTYQEREEKRTGSSELRSARIELCPRSSKIGWVGIGVFFLACLIGIAATNVALALFMAAMTAIPLIALCQPQIQASRASIGKQVEVSGDSVALFEGDREIWRVRWQEVRSVNANQAFRLVRNDGEEFSVPVVNLKRSQIDTLRSYIPAGLRLETTLPVLIKPTKRTEAVAMTALGFVIFSWGLVGVFQRDPNSPNLALMGIHALGMVLGVFPAAIGITTLRRAKKPAPTEVAAVNLKTHLTAGSESQFSNQTCRWIPSPRANGYRKFLGITLLIPVPLWTLAAAAVMWGSFTDPNLRAMIGPYLLIVAFNLWGVFEWRKMLPPEGWLILTHGDQMEAVFEGQVYSLKLTRLAKGESVQVHFNGKTRSLYAAEFVRDERGLE